MKAPIKSIIALLITPFVLQAANVAQVLSETPDGAMLSTGSNITVGSNLSTGDVLLTNGSTVILSLCEGSRLTVYPNSEIKMTSVSNGTVSVKLVKGEIIGDATSSCSLDIQTKVGVASVTDGVFGISQNVSGGQGWTMQVRNLDAQVSLLGDAKLETGNIAVSMVEPNKSTVIPAGEKITVRGVYTESTEVFALSQGGALGTLSQSEENDLLSAQQKMSSVTIPQPTPIIIEIPWNDIEEASDKG